MSRKKFSETDFQPESQSLQICHEPCRPLGCHQRKSATLELGCQREKGGTKVAARHLLRVCLPKRQGQSGHLRAAAVPPRKALPLFGRSCKLRAKWRCAQRRNYVPTVRRRVVIWVRRIRARRLLDEWALGRASLICARGLAPIVQVRNCETFCRIRTQLQSHDE